MPRAIATASLFGIGADFRLQLWKVEEEGEKRTVDYIATLSKHTQAVNVVRWAPKGEPTPIARSDPSIAMFLTPHLPSQARSSHLLATMET